MANDKTDYWGREVEKNDKSFEEVRDQLYFEHHYHPTYIPTFNVSRADQARQAELDAQTENLGKQGKGKTWVNGLPGAVSSEPFVGDFVPLDQSIFNGCVKFVAAVFVITMLIMIGLAIKANTGGF